MTDRPIIFSAPMVLALLDGRKTMTRRLAWRTSVWADEPAEVRTNWCRVKSGDRLWVREGWKPHSTFASVRPRDIPKSKIFYIADDAYAPSNTAWRPSIHMPRWASRLTLTVTAVKIERLQEISEADALAEGVACPDCRGRGWYAADPFAPDIANIRAKQCERCAEEARAAGVQWEPMEHGRGQYVRKPPRNAFAELWHQLHGEASWAANPLHRRQAEHRFDEGGGMKIVWDEGDEIEAGLIENIRLGLVAIVDVQPDGEPLFKMTPKGGDRMKALLARQAQPKRERRR